MAGSFSITISNLSALNIGGTRRSEAVEIEEMVHRALQVMVANHQTSVSFKDRNGNAAGTISWTPANSA
jgi:hypothetical protein